jgi:hypothetical protein
MLGRRQARRMSRRFAAVGVPIPPARLRAMAAGAPAADDELTDVTFAFAATEIEREQRHAKFVHGRRCAIQSLIVTGTVLLMLAMLICMAYGMLVLTQPAPPY